ncbi:hypothetical protein GGR56DRAFT_670024 [Xylariaceae sp. FL0804]|nr:hypothetical protein GGR56DRAFT_670024 [Xylariaceae sp. FL0804]
MLAPLLEAARQLGPAHSPPAVPEAVSRAVPDKVTTEDLHALVTKNADEDPIPLLWATYAILERGNVAASDSEHGDASTAQLADVAARVGELTLPICSGASPAGDETDYGALRLKTSLGLHVLDRLDRLDRLASTGAAATTPAAILGDEALLAAAACAGRVRDEDPWTSPADAALARALLARHFFSDAHDDEIKEAQAQAEARRTRFVAEAVLTRFLRPLFERAPRPAGLTATGRAAAFDDDGGDGGGGGGARRRFRLGGDDDEERAARPWRYEWRCAVAVFEWAVENSDATLLQKHWPLFTPVLLALLDDHHDDYHDHDAGGQRVVRALRLARAFWARCPQGLLRRTGLAAVLERAVFPFVLCLPSLTPEPESAALLAAAYPALLDMAGVDGDVDDGDDDDDDEDHDEEEEGEEEKEKASPQTTPQPQPQTQTRPPIRFDDAQRKLLDRIVREGIMVGYHHAKEHVGLVGLLCEQLRRLVQGMGILAVRHLKDILPMLSEILTDPFGPQHPPTLLSAARLLRAVLAACWPRVPRHCAAVTEMLMLCWLNVDDEDEDDDDDSLTPTTTTTDPTSRTKKLKAELARAAAMLAAIMQAAGEDYQAAYVGPLVKRAPALRGVFGEHAS